MGSYSVIILFWQTQITQKLWQIILCAFGLVGFNSVILNEILQTHFSGPVVLWAPAVSLYIFYILRLQKSLWNLFVCLWACGLLQCHYIILTNSDYSKLCQIILCAFGLVGFNSVIINEILQTHFSGPVVLWAPAVSLYIFYILRLQKSLRNLFVCLWACGLLQCHYIILTNSDYTKTLTNYFVCLWACGLQQCHFKWDFTNSF